MKLKLYPEQYRKSLRLAAPVMLAQVGIVSVQLFDNAMVGNLGALPLASVAFGGTVFFVLFLFINGLAMALTPVVGEEYSLKKHTVLSAYLQNSIVLFTCIGVLTFLVQMALIPLLYYLGQPPEVVKMAIPYYKYLVWSIIPYMLFCSFKQFLEGIGNTMINMIIILVSNGINILFNWLLIYGNLGFPRMEAEGAGLATLISRICMPVLAILFFACIPRFRAYLKNFNRDNFKFIYNWKLLIIGFPISLQMMMEGSAFIITSLMMGWIGTAEIAGNQIAMILSNFAFMVVVGLGSATTIRISHEYGHKNYLELKKVVNASYHLTLLWNFLSASVFVIFREQIAGIFTNDPEVLRMASLLLLFVAAFQFSDGLQSISVGILRGIQDVKRIMIIAFFSYIVINIPVGYFCAFILGWGAAGLWTGFIFGLSVAAFLLISRVIKQKSKLVKSLNTTSSPSL